jgi:hypothetical protein
LTGLGWKGALPQEKFRKGGRHIKHCCRVKQSAVVTKQNAKLGTANAYAIFQHRLKHRM